MLGYLKRVFFREPAAASASARAFSVAAQMPARSAAPLRPRRTAPVTVAPPVEPVVPSIALSLLATFELLPQELQSLAKGPIPPYAQFAVPLQQISDQLPRGSVRIPFSQFRLAAPAELFGETPEHDEQQISLPLSEILSLVKPARRVQQQRIEIPGNIPVMFGTARPEVPTPEAAQPLHLVDEVPTPNTPDAIEEPVVAESAAEPEPVPVETPPLKFVLQEDLVSAPTEEPVEAESVSDSTPKFVELDVAQICAAWPEALVGELAATPDARLSIPAERLEPMVKRGRIAFPWSELRGWMQPTLPSSDYDDALVQLPAAIIAPIYLHAIGAGPAPSAVLPAPAFAIPQPIRPAADFAPLSPQEAVAEALALKGAAGALCTSQDGLLIAGEMPDGLKAPTMAAFLPGLLTRLAQYSATVNLGGLESIRLQTSGGMLDARRIAGVTLAVLSKPGAELDPAAIAQIGNRLGARLSS